MDPRRSKIQRDLLELPQGTLAPCRLQTNEIVANAVRRNYGSARFLVQSGLNGWWRKIKGLTRFALCLTEVVLSGRAVSQSCLSCTLKGQNQNVARQPSSTTCRFARNDALVRSTGGDVGRQSLQESPYGDRLEALPEEHDPEDAIADPGPQVCWASVGEYPDGHQVVLRAPLHREDKDFFICY